MPVIPIAWYQRTASISKKVYDGIDFVVIAVGLFGVAEIASNLEFKGARGVLQSTIGADLDFAVDPQEPERGFRSQRRLGEGHGFASVDKPAVSHGVVA